jgi:hypothetical protein
MPYSVLERKRAFDSPVAPWYAHALAGPAGNYPEPQRARQSRNEVIIQLHASTRHVATENFITTFQLDRVFSSAARMVWLMPTSGHVHSPDQPTVRGAPSKLAHPAAIETFSVARKQSVSCTRTHEMLSDGFKAQHLLWMVKLRPVKLTPSEAWRTRCERDANCCNLVKRSHVFEGTLVRVAGCVVSGGRPASSGTHAARRSRRGRRSQLLVGGIDQRSYSGSCYRCESDLAPFCAVHARWDPARSCCPQDSHVRMRDDDASLTEVDPCISCDW